MAVDYYLSKRKERSCLMSATVIGRVRGSSGKSYEVKWDSGDRNVYVSVAGWSKAGKAGSASDAMKIAEAYVYNK
jgi:hypothetical protein